MHSGALENSEFRIGNSQFIFCPKTCTSCMCTNTSVMSISQIIDHLNSAHNCTTILCEKNPGVGTQYSVVPIMPLINSSLSLRLLIWVEWLGWSPRVFQFYGLVILVFSKKGSFWFKFNNTMSFKKIFKTCNLT